MRQARSSRLYIHFPAIRAHAKTAAQRPRPPDRPRALSSKAMVKEGDKLPAATLKHMDASGIQDISTAELTAGKKVVIVSVPGAFTPTCSRDHVPGFLKHADALKAKGVDTIAVVSVNDAFVMAAWAEKLGTGNTILMLADGNGEFAKALDLELDARAFGLGMRSQRFAMVVDNGVVTKLAVEPGGALTCSAADAVLAML